MLGFLRARRRRRLLAEPFPAAWQATLHRDVGLYATLDAGERSRLRDDLRIFIAETGWEASRGFALTDEMRVIVAANACLLVLGLDGDPLRRVRTIIVQPDAYVPPQPTMAGGGVVRSGGRASGTAYVNGTVVLSWASVVAHSRDPHDGCNVVVHEFAHQLDMIGGIVDGTPPLASDALRARWKRVMTGTYAELVNDVDRGAPTLIDAYGSTSPGEFFAVCSELFLERPVRMRERHPEVYDLLRAFYRQDPAARAERAGRVGGEW